MNEPAHKHETGAPSSPTGAPAPERPGSRPRRWVWGLALAALLLGATAAALLVPAFVLRRIVDEAGRRGVRLSGCSLELGLRRAVLRGCSFASPAVPDVPSPVPGVSFEGRAAEVDISVENWSPSRVVVRGMEVEATGMPLDRDVLRSGGGGWSPLPVDVEAGTITWRFGDDGPSSLRLTEVAYSSAAETLSASWEWPGRARGRMSTRGGELELTFGDTAPSARLLVRPIPAQQRAELRLELRDFPLSLLEGPSLRLTETLRAIRVDGHVFMNLPTALQMELAAGDLYLTLKGLQFPVPREVEGLVYASPPRISGKIDVSRNFDRATIRELGFLTGQLEMTGRAELTLDPALRGLSFQAHMSGPLSCRAIAASAATAHAGSAIGKLGGRLANSVLSGDVQIVAALSGQTWQLDQTSVLTSVGVGCGLRPLPVDLNAAAEILARLPAEVLQKLPRSSTLPALPQLRLPERWGQPRAQPSTPAAPRN